jgi:hypothetical protein
VAKASDFQKGDKVFLDTFAGLVPAVVVGPMRPQDYRENVAFEYHPSGRHYDPDRYVRIRYTASRGAYKKGEVVVTPTRDVVKREWVHQRSGMLYIREPARPKKTL